MRHRSLIPTSAVAIAAVSLLAAGCGSGALATTAATGQNGLVAYSHCIRSHGVPTFPDPTSSEGIPKDRVPVGNPHFLNASNDCKHLMPAGGLGPQTTPRQTLTRVADETSFARCFRTHGFPNFPDPTTSGQITHQMLANAEINLDQPAILQAADACVSVTHGIITKASVAGFIAGR